MHFATHKGQKRAAYGISEVSSGHYVFLRIRDFEACVTV